MELSLLAYGVLVHLVLLYSIFDIFYSSPLVRNARSHPITKHRGPANRLVIFSADGLRSSSFYGHPEKSPFLHDLIRNGRAAWGISQSHVPTESRPGHVAFMAGFYEDVSAVARGWKHNPVQFDSIVNQSRAAWLWGSADIVMLFSDHDSGGRIVHRDSYSPDLEIFGDENEEELDKWVFDKVEQYFSENASAVVSNYGTERSLFFLHLLGLDTIGHGKKPRSDNYLNNIGVVDAGVKRIVELFWKVFKDDKTAFLFTADHGMTDWGSHGAGTDDEILVPFVAWGAGVTATRGRRLVINQVDLTPFQAALLGIAVPVNNVGVLPLPMLNASAAYRFSAAYGNLKQMIEQYAIKRTERLRNSLPLLFRDYHAFTADALEKVRAEIRRLADARRFDAAATACVEWIPFVRDALLYFHRYQRFSLGLAVISLFIGWITLVYHLGLSRNLSHRYSTFVPNRQFTVVLVVAILLIAYQRLPVTNYLYFLLPILTFSIAWNLSQKLAETAVERQLKKSDAIRHSTIMSEKHNFWCFTSCSVDWTDLVEFLKSRLPTALLAISLAGISLTILVSVFFERFVCSIMFAFLAPLSFFNVRTNKTKAGKWRHVWAVSSILLGVFPLSDTVGRTERPWLVVAAPFACALLLRIYNRSGFVGADRGQITLPNQSGAVRSSTIHLLSVFCALSGVLMTLNYMFQASAFLTLLVRVFSWLSLPTAAALPLLCAPDNLPDFLVAWMAALFPPYALLSIAYESLFVVVFGVFLFAFVRLEFGHMSDSEFYSLNLADATAIASKNGAADPSTDADAGSRFSPDEWRRALLLVCMVEMAFFGTGNIASLNSFNTNFLRNFVTVFSPFLMAALLALKMAIPFFQLAMAYALLLRWESGANVRRKRAELESNYKESLIRLSALIMIITDVMAIVFFYHLKDDGSWLEIGISISNYVISMVSSIAVFLLLHLAYHLTCLRFQWTL